MSVPHRSAAMSGLAAPGPGTAKNALELRDVGKRFGPHWAVARLSYSLPERPSLLLTGHNGSGKTTLLRLIAAAATPTAGTLVVLGNDAVKERALVREQVGLLSHASF